MMLPEFNLIDEEEKVVKQKILQSKNTLPSQLSSHLAEAKKQEVKITNDIQAQKLNVSKSSKSERDQLQAKINEFIKNYNRLKINQQQIFENKTKQIKEKLEVLKKSKELFYANTKNTYDALHQEFIKDLRILDKQFSSDSTGIRETSMDNMIEIKNRCDLAFDNITNRIKDNINLFNDLVNLLISKQAKYGQMK